MVKTKSLPRWRKIESAWCGSGLGAASTPRRAYLCPCGILWGKVAQTAVATGSALPLLGTGAFTSCQVVLRYNGYYEVCHMTTEALGLWRSTLREPLLCQVEEFIGNLANIRETWQGGPQRVPSIIGILNVTPDSFSDGGEYLKVGQAIEHAHYMVSCGAALVDIGGESTKPSAAPISSSVERKRVLPIVKALVEDGVQVSIDTYHPDTMEEASALGASVINDISGFTAYPNSKQVGAASGRALVLVHSLPLETERGAVFDGEVAIEIYENLFEQIKAMELLGVSRGRIVVDPGLGFEKSHKSNFSALRWMGILHGLGCQIMIGASRKFGRMQKGQSPKDRLPGSIAASLYGTEQGAHFLRVHDVAEIQQALGVWRSIT